MKPIRRLFRSLSSTADASEVAKFSRLSAQWWKPEGAGVGPLHAMNPVRLAYIRNHLQSHFAKTSTILDGRYAPLRGLRILDVGCGGGILTEPLARLGACVTGIDASADNIRVAKDHAGKDPSLRLLSEEEATGANPVGNGDHSVGYAAMTAEELLARGGKRAFDAVTLMEIVEHVIDPGLFLHTCAALVKPGGAMFISTINRTLLSYLATVLGAEYLLRLLPVGTHHWDKYLTPTELKQALENPPEPMLPLQFTPEGPKRVEVALPPRSLIRVENVSGLVFNPLTGAWSLQEATECALLGSRGILGTVLPQPTDINYIVYCRVFDGEEQPQEQAEQQQPSEPKATA